MTNFWQQRSAQHGEKQTGQHSTQHTHPPGKACREQALVLAPSFPLHERERVATRGHQFRVLVCVRAIHLLCGETLLGFGAKHRGVLLQQSDTSWK